MTEAFAIKLASAKFRRSETHHIANVTLTNWFSKFTAKNMKKCIPPDRYPDMKYVITEKRNGTAMSMSIGFQRCIPSVTRWDRRYPKMNAIGEYILSCLSRSYTYIRKE